MTRLSYHFDFISPFSYFLHEQLHRLPEDVEINYVPTLFAGLLKHWGNLGPVEITPKKKFTYQHSTWLASKLGVPFKMPKSHPFNPLPYLRLSIAMNNEPELITRIYKEIWTGTADPAEPQGRDQIFNNLGIDNANTLVENSAVKNQLIQNTNLAINNGVFGVPTIIANGNLFWGFDSFEFLLDYLGDPSLFESDEMKQLSSIQDGTLPRHS